MHLRSNIVFRLSPTARKMEYVLDSFVTATGGSINLKFTYVIRKRIHNHRVKSIVPADKLLVYNVKQGWKPLCDFLECKVPTIAFSHENIKAEITKTISNTRYNQQLKLEVQRYRILCTISGPLSVRLYGTKCFTVSAGQKTRRVQFQSTINKLKG